MLFSIVITNHRATSLRALAARLSLFSPRPVRSFNKGKPLDLSKSLSSVVQGATYRHMPGVCLSIQNKPRGKRAHHYEWDPVTHLLKREATSKGVVTEYTHDEFDEVIGLEAGANDYVIKPVRPRALLARINSALKSKSAQALPSNEQTFGSLTINTDANRVTYQGKEIELSTSLFLFLCFLASHAGQVATSRGRVVPRAWARS